MTNKIYNSNAYLNTLDKYFRACNYLSVAQLYLLNNPLLKEPFSKDDVKKQIHGHWGTIPAQNFVYAHLNRVIKKYDLNIDFWTRTWWKLLYCKQLFRRQI